MKVMRLNEDSNAVALVAFLIFPYPLVFVASLLGWPRGVQLALACFSVVVLFGTKLVLVVRDRRRSRRHR